MPDRLLAAVAGARRAGARRRAARGGRAPPARGRREPADGYVFRHTLTRDAIYERHAAARARAHPCGVRAARCRRPGAGRDDGAPTAAGARAALVGRPRPPARAARVRRGGAAGRRLRAGRGAAPPRARARDVAAACPTPRSAAASTSSSCCAAPASPPTRAGALDRSLALLDEALGELGAERRRRSAARCCSRRRAQALLDLGRQRRGDRGARAGGVAAARRAADRGPRVGARVARDPATDRGDFEPRRGDRRAGRRPRREAAGAREQEAERADHARHRARVPRRQRRGPRALVRQGAGARRGGRRPRDRAARPCSTCPTRSSMLGRYEEAAETARRGLDARAPRRARRATSSAST